jgi:hypothetical protein
LLNKKCIDYYPAFKVPRGTQPQQHAAWNSGAELVALPAGRSAILYHRARKLLSEHENSYMMPNALKLTESVAETAAEAKRTPLTSEIKTIIIPSSSATIAAGVIAGYGNRFNYVIHLGYSRSADQVWNYIIKMASPFLPVGQFIHMDIIDEGYSYADKAKPGPVTDWPCNTYYDLKAFRWWKAGGCEGRGVGLLWNIG